MATFFAALRRPAWGRRPRQSPGGQGRRVSPRQTIFKVVGSRPDGRVRVSPRGRVPFCVDKKEPKNHLGAQIGLASGQRAPLARRICPLRTPVFTGARVEVPEQLSGVLTLTVRRFHRRPPPGAGMLSVALCTQRGRLMRCWAELTARFGGRRKRPKSYTRSGDHRGQAGSSALVQASGSGMRE